MTPFCRLSEGEVFSIYLSHVILAASPDMPLKNKAESAFRKIIEQTADDVANRAIRMAEKYGRTLVKPS